MFLLLFLITKNYRIKRKIFHKELPGKFPVDKIKSASPDPRQNQIKGETLSHKNILRVYNFGCDVNPEHGKIRTQLEFLSA